MWTSADTPLIHVDLCRSQHGTPPKVQPLFRRQNPGAGEILIVMSQPSTTLFKYNGVWLITINKNVNISITTEIQKEIVKATTERV